MNVLCLLCFVLSCSGSEALLYHLSEVKGMALWKQKYQPLGLDPAVIEGKGQQIHTHRHYIYCIIVIKPVFCR